MDSRGDRDHPGGAGLGRDLKILDGIASWCGAVHGSMHLSDALAAISEAIGCEVAAISREGRADGHGRLVAAHDARESDCDAVSFKRAMAEDVLGDFYNRVRAGTVWFLSDHVHDPDFRTSTGLNGWLLSRGIEEIVVVALESSGLQHDYLEFHFDQPVSRSEKAEFESVMPTLVRAWSGRKTGLVTQAQMDERMVRARRRAEEARIKPSEPILGVSNPAKLSRAEFRVCILLSRGLSIKAVTEELGLTESTIRSHLRSIYAKTYTKSLAELLYRLLSTQNDEARVGLAQ